MDNIKDVAKNGEIKECRMLMSSRKCNSLWIMILWNRLEIMDNILFSLLKAKDEKSLIM